MTGVVVQGHKYVVLTFKMKCALVLNRARLWGVCGHTGELTIVEISRQIYSILHHKKPAKLLDRADIGGKVQGRFPMKSGCFLFEYGFTNSNPLTVFTVQMDGNVGN